MTTLVQYTKQGASLERIRYLRWKAVERTRYAWYLKARDLVSRQFHAEKRRMMAAVKVTETRQHAMDAASEVIDAERPRWDTLLKRLYLGLSRDFGRLALSQVKYQPGPALEAKAPGPNLRQWMATESAAKVTMITDTTRERIRTLLAQEIDEGASMLDVADALKDVYEINMIPHRALLVARTEVTAGSNAVQNLALLDDPDIANEQTFKSWLSSRDDVVRESHAELDGQEVRLDEPFVIDGYELMWPGDSSGGAPVEMIVNCRCSETYRTEASV